MIVEDGERLRIQGPITMESVGDLLDAGRALCGGTDCVTGRILDLSEADPVDSAALALVLAWMREVESRGGVVRIDGISGQLRSLAALYDIADLLPIGDAAA
ncbi:STAS domain-containing protein [Niveibacterium terrae]|uniref:STAS domain-containing protein n=1 Tax=Niveibacterium terrae TaxID=3373598 RepID=UPI003A90757F